MKNEKVIHTWQIHAHIYNKEIWKCFVSFSPSHFLEWNICEHDVRLTFMYICFRGKFSHFRNSFTTFQYIRVLERGDAKHALNSETPPQTLPNLDLYSESWTLSSFRVILIPFVTNWQGNGPGWAFHCLRQKKGSAKYTSRYCVGAR